MRTYGHIDFQQNEIQNAAIQLSTDFPVTPVVGQLVFLNKVLYICAEIASGIPAWIPLTNEINSYIHTQQTANTTWSITHNLGTGSPLVQVYDQDTNTLVIPGNVEPIDANTVNVTFGAAVRG